MSELQSRSTTDAVQNLLPGQYLVAGEHDRISTVPNIALRIIELSTSSLCPLGRSSAFVLAPDFLPKLSDDREGRRSVLNWPARGLELKKERTKAKVCWSYTRSSRSII